MPENSQVSSRSESPTPEPQVAPHEHEKAPAPAEQATPEASEEPLAPPASQPPGLPAVRTALPVQGASAQALAPSADAGTASDRRPIPWSLVFTGLFLLVALATLWWANKSGRLGPAVHQGNLLWRWLRDEKPDHATASKEKMSGKMRMHGKKKTPGKMKMGAKMKMPPTMKGLVTIDPRTTQELDVTSTLVTRRTLVKSILATGAVNYDEKLSRKITAWIGGRLDRLYVDEVGQVVKRGEPVAAIYSPQLYGTEQELLQAVDYLDELKRNHALPEAVAEARDLVDATRTRLSLWGVTQPQIKRLEKSRKLSDHTVIYARIPGTVVAKPVEEGAYVKQGSILYRVVDLHTVWIYLEVYEQDIGLVHLGQKVDITTVSRPGESFSGRVTFIEPVMDARARAVRVRVTVHNRNHELLPGMYAEGSIKAPVATDALAVPESAVIRTGLRDIVLLSLGHGHFLPRRVRLGARVRNYYQVRSGLKAGDRVVTQASFLINSESQLQSALGQMGMPGMPGMKMKH